jgi:3-oxo-5-alpha-steroid 4-dehydrogenase 1
MMGQFIYRILLVSIFAFIAVVIASLFLVTAPYGRHSRKGWGYTIRARLGWLIMEFPAFFVMIFMFITGNRQANPVAIVFISMWAIHYAHRTFIYPFIMKGGDKRLPFLIILFALIFNTINGYINGYYLFSLSPLYDSKWFLDPRFILGSIIFFSGFIINLHSDHILRNLRKPGQNGYKIPRRGLFKYISCPNYFGEIIEWTGWAIATWSLPGLAFALFTFANLAPRASSNHRWYLKRFPGYPKGRKALIPFIY